MSNLSNIGFNVETKEEFMTLLTRVSKNGNPIPVRDGKYVVYADASGAELWLQVNKENQGMGANPHYAGKSKRTVCLTHAVDRRGSPLDGAYHAWAAPSVADDPDSGEYPFVFDLPDFKTIGNINFPKNYDIQLAAFAHDLSIYRSEQDFDEHQTEPKFASQSFIPSGLFASAEDDSDPTPTMGLFAGIIREYERKTNGLTGHDFYWLLVDTLGGDIDVVADIRFFDAEPQIGGVVHGQFWLSGRLIAPPIAPAEKKSLFKKLLGR